MSFAVAAEAYDKFMGKYSIQLSPALADYAAVRSGQRVIDVGCGPGALTGELVKRLGASSVAAIDPSEPFVAAVRRRFPGVDARHASAERIPFDDAAFDAALAQLVVHFMTDPVAGLREMARVVRKDGAIAACVWDHGSGRGPLSTFWKAARQLDPDVADESRGTGARQGHLAQLFREAGLKQVEETLIPSTMHYETFEEWWTPFTLGVGPAGAYTAKLDPDRRSALREGCRRLFPSGPFDLVARAWTARGFV